MKHFILTRFNLLMPGWDNQLRLSSAWLDKRFRLFEDICLPSVASQTNQDFEWLVFFDTKTPEEYKNKINDLIKIFKFHPIYIDIFDLAVISGHVRARCTEGDVLLTSRLDSDDVISVDYVEKLHSLSSSLAGVQVINFDNGAILSSKNNSNRLYEYEDDSNPFTSLLEPYATDLKTILAVRHTDLHDFANVKHVKGKPMWLQVVHGGNVGNQVRGKRVKLDTFNTDFIYMRAISLRASESELILLFDNLILGTYRELRDGCRKLIKEVYFKVKSCI